MPTPKPTNSTLHKMLATFSLASYLGVGVAAAIGAVELKNSVKWKMDNKKETEDKGPEAN